MTRHRSPRFRRGGTPPMRPDDRVGPGIRRRAGFVAIAISSLLFGIGLPIGFNLVTGVAQDAQQTSGLTQDEVAEFRAYLTDRGKQRDAERAAVQAELDQQTAALCAALAEVAKDAGPSGRAALARAGKSLGCAALPKKPKSTTSSSSSSGVDGSASTTGDDATDRDRDDQGGPSRGAPASGSSKPRPADTPSPSQSPPPPPASDDGGLVDDVTGTVCDLLGVCL